MKKKITISLLIGIFSFSHAPSALRADSYDESAVVAEQIATPSPSSMTGSADMTDSDEEDTESEIPEGSPVSPSDGTAAKKSNRQFWTNILVAAAAVIVAVVSIAVVSNNNGKKQ